MGILGGLSVFLRLWRLITPGLLRLSGVVFVPWRLDGCGALLAVRCGLLLLGMRLLAAWMTSRGR